MTTTNYVLIGGRKTINPKDVILLEADENYTQIHFVNGAKITVATTLKRLEERFSGCIEFFRTHKSYLINLNYIKQISNLGGEVHVKMRNDYKVTISRRKKCAFCDRLSAIGLN